MSLADRIRGLFKANEPDRPLTEEERHEHVPETSYEVRSDLEQDFVGRDLDPEEPRSGRV